jgi:hypothetical protein
MVGYGDLHSTNWSAKLWEVASGDLSVTLATTGPAFHIAYSPTGQQVAVATFDYVELWALGEGEPQQTLLETESALYYNFSGLAFSPDGRLLAAGNSYGVRRCGTWQAATCCAT